MQRKGLTLSLLSVQIIYIKLHISPTRSNNTVHLIRLFMGSKLQYQLLYTTTWDTDI